MDIKQLVGDNMRAARKLKKLTQQKVADHWGMKQTQYSRYERGIYELDYERIVSLCKLLDLSPNELFGFDEYKGFP